jgi:hypothetical protein
MHEHCAFLANRAASSPLDLPPTWQGLNAMGINSVRAQLPGGYL